MIALPPLAAEVLFHLGPLPVTNSLVNTVVATLLISLFAFFFSRTIRVSPSKLQLVVEEVLEQLLGYFDKVTNERALSRKFLPFVGTLFFFILISNWLGLLPGTGSIGFWEMHGAEREFIPLFRPANSDLNLTLALSILTVFTSHAVGMASVGVFSHLNRFIQLGTIWQALKARKFMGILTAMVEFVVGLIELMTEFAKMASLSLRLFGNIFAGEVLTTVIASLFAFAAPLPFIGLELIVGVIQATVFAMLALVYLTLFSRKPHGSNEAHEPVASH
jgi:F-type H+-transporting ATPase subunit a